MEEGGGQRKKLSLPVGEQLSKAKWWLRTQVGDKELFDRMVAGSGYLFAPIS